MAGTIKHSWNGTVLTIESDSGVSSCDLKGATGDTGIRGPQGIAGDKGERGPAGERGPVGENGVGVPVGGSAGQVLTKASDSDYDTKWDAVPALQDLSGMLPISSGGTGANNATDALANLGAFRFLGNNVITSINNDTPSNWGTLGSGYAFFSNNGLVNDQPSQWGIVVNFVTGSDIFQMWRAQTSGPTYWRSGNADGWHGTWVKVYDTANKPALSDLDGQPTPTLSSTDESAVERTQYTYIGNMLVMSGITPEVECANNAVTSYSVWFPKTFTSGCTVMASLYYNNDESSSAAFVNAVAGWYQNNTMVIKFSNTSGGTKNLRASWIAIGM